jgi:hypothetical protein
MAMGRSGAAQNDLMAKWPEMPQSPVTCFTMACLRQRLALPLAVDPRQVLGGRRLDPAHLRHPRQQLAVAFAVVALQDWAQYRVVETSTPIRSA